MLGGYPMDRVLYFEPLLGYIGRKHFPLLLATTPILLLLAVDTWRPEGWGLSVPWVAFHLILAALSLTLLVAERNRFRFVRFQISDDGFLLPGSKTGPAGARFVRYEHVRSVEAIAVWHRASNHLVYIRLRVVWPRQDTTRDSQEDSEVTLDVEAIGRRCLIRLWQEWVRRGIASEESLQFVAAAK